MSDTQYDLAIIGGAAAGCAAAIFACRQGLSVAVVTQDVGGQMLVTETIENYPGIQQIGGPALAGAFRDHAAAAGATFILQRVTDVTPVDRHFTVQTGAGELTARAIVLAFGLSPRTLDVPGESALIDRGIVYSGVDDPTPYAGQRVVVIGGGSAAVTTALTLSQTAAWVYLVHRRDVLVAETALVKQLEERNNITVFLSHEVSAFRGRKQLESVVIRPAGGAEEAVLIDTAVICVGYTATTDWLSGLVERTDRGTVVVDAHGRTSQPGVFAAGDLTELPYKQVVISAGEGAKAALAAAQYLAGRDGVAPPDWGASR